MVNFVLVKRKYDENRNLCSKGYLKNIPSFQSTKYCFNPYFKIIKKFEQTNIKVYPLDSLKVAQYFINYGFDPLILNMADVNFPGGGIEMGGYAQEESLFCRSNYFKTLNIETGFYPINDASVIYSPNVFVFRDTDLSFLDKPFFVSMVASAAVKEPHLENNKLSKIDLELTKQKIETIFQTAILNNHNSLILSAYGCGAYKNPHSCILKAFEDTIKKYNGVFKLIAFAILPKSKMNGRYILKGFNDNDNYSIFKNYFDKNFEI